MWSLREGGKNKVYDIPFVFFLLTSHGIVRGNQAEHSIPTELRKQKLEFREVAVVRVYRGESQRVGSYGEREF